MNIKTLINEWHAGKSFTDEKHLSSNRGVLSYYGQAMALNYRSKLDNKRHIIVSESALSLLRHRSNMCIVEPRELREMIHLYMAYSGPASTFNAMGYFHGFMPIDWNDELWRFVHGANYQYDRSHMNKIIWHNNKELFLFTKTQLCYAGLQIHYFTEFIPYDWSYHKPKWYAYAIGNRNDIPLIKIMDDECIIVDIPKVITAINIHNETIRNQNRTSRETIS